MGKGDGGFNYSHPLSPLVFLAEMKRNLQNRESKMRRDGAGGEFLFSSLRLLVPKIFKKSLSLATRGAKRIQNFFFDT